MLVYFEEVSGRESNVEWQTYKGKELNKRRKENMFFVILGIIGFIVAILAVFMVHRLFPTNRVGLSLLWSAIGVIFFLAGVCGTTKVILDTYDICDTERTINAYVDSEYSEGLYCDIRYLDNKKAWADTPFSLWSSKKIKVLRYKAVESYNEIIRSKQTNKPKNEPKKKQ